MSSITSRGTMIADEGVSAWAFHELIETWKLWVVATIIPTIVSAGAVVVALPSLRPWSWRQSWWRAGSVSRRIVSTQTSGTRCHASLSRYDTRGPLASGPSWNCFSFSTLGSRPAHPALHSTPGQL